jgi:ESS family glutamate:Na+ symporter
MIEMPFDNYMSYTIGIVVFFMGVYLTKNIKFLRDFNIPEPVTGGLLAALFIYAVYIFTGSEIAFDLSTRDRLLVYFLPLLGLTLGFLI